MAVIPANISRTSDALRWALLTDTIRRHSLDALRMQRQLSSGQRLLAPSDDPAAARLVLALERSLEESAQYLTNLQRGATYLQATDGALAEVAESIPTATWTPSLRLTPSSGRSTAGPACRAAPSSSATAPPPRPST